MALLWHHLRQLMVHSDLPTLQSHSSGSDIKTGTYQKFTLTLVCLVTALLKQFCPNEAVSRQLCTAGFSGGFKTRRLLSEHLPRDKEDASRMEVSGLTRGAAHLVSPAPAAGPAPAAPAPPAASAAAPGAPQVSEVDLQLGRDVVGGLAEVVIHDRILSVSLQPAAVLHQQGKSTKTPSWPPPPATPGLPLQFLRKQSIWPFQENLWVHTIAELEKSSRTESSLCPIPSLSPARVQSSPGHTPGMGNPNLPGQLLPMPEHPSHREMLPKTPSEQHVLNPRPDYYQACKESPVVSILTLCPGSTNSFHSFSTLGHPSWFCSLRIYTLFSPW